MSIKEIIATIATSVTVSGILLGAGYKAGYFIKENEINKELSTYKSKVYNDSIKANNDIKLLELKMKTEIEINKNAVIQSNNYEKLRMRKSIDSLMQDRRMIPCPYCGK